jgi:hypothetical protein
VNGTKKIINTANGPYNPLELQKEGQNVPK